MFVAEVTNDEANDLADEILTGEEFIGEAEPGPVRRALDRVLEFIGDILESIFGGLGSAVGSGLGTILAYGLLGLAVIVLLYAIYRAVTNRVPKTEAESTSDTRVVFDEIVEPAQLQSLLAQYRSQSDWRNAVVAGFRLAVVGLIDQGIAREVAGATTGYFAQAVDERRPDITPQFAPAAESFDRAFYSDLDIGPDDLAQVDTLLGRLDRVGAS